MTTRYIATGKRKSSIARVIVQPGKGQITINGKDVNEYFSDAVLVQKINVPFGVTETNGQYDVVVNVHGGGTTGQAEAIMYGIAKSLLQVNDDLRSALKAEGLLTRDARIKERRKYGLKKARKAPQFSKR